MVAGRGLAVTDSEFSTVVRLCLFHRSSADLTIIVCLVCRAGQELRGGAWMWGVGVEGREHSRG
jgi:hypothetical protein